MDRFFVDAQNSIYLDGQECIFVWLDLLAQKRLNEDGANLNLGSFIKCKDENIVFDAQVSHYEGDHLYLRTNLKSRK